MIPKEKLSGYGEIPDRRSPQPSFNKERIKL